MRMKMPSTTTTTTTTTTTNNNNNNNNNTINKNNPTHLENLPNEILTECLVYLPLQDSYSFALTCTSFYNTTWKESCNAKKEEEEEESSSLLFIKLMQRDYPSYRTQHHNNNNNNTKNNPPPPPPPKNKIPKPKQMYKLHTSISNAHNPRWYKLNIHSSNSNKIGRRQGFGKASLFGCPIVYGGWVVSSRGHDGFVIVENDVLYLTQTKTKTKTKSKRENKRNGGATSLDSNGVALSSSYTTQTSHHHHPPTPPPTTPTSQSNKLEYKWKTLNNNITGTPPPHSYCVSTTACDSIPLSILFKGIPALKQISVTKNWMVRAQTKVPVLFVSGGVRDGGYRFAYSYLYAAVGGIPHRSTSCTLQEEEEEKEHNDDDDEKEEEEDVLQKYTWHWIKLSGGTHDEIPQDATTTTTLEEALHSVNDSIHPPSFYSSTSSSSSHKCASNVVTYGGSARACHSLWYNPVIQSVCTFGGFTDTVARKAHVVPNGAFQSVSRRGEEDEEEEENLHYEWPSHQQALHQLEIFSLESGTWIKVVQSGDEPIARFGCSVIDISSTTTTTTTTNVAAAAADQENGKHKAAVVVGTYLIIGGCTGRHYHKGPMEDGHELTSPSTHRVLTLYQQQPQIKAKWRKLTKTERVNLQLHHTTHNNNDKHKNNSSSAVTALGRMHATCDFSKHSRIFFGGGPSEQCSSSLLLMKHCLDGGGDGGGGDGGGGISWKWKNKGMPLNSYHTWDGDDRNRAATFIVEGDQQQDYSHQNNNNNNNSNNTTAPYVPPLQLARMDCLLEADPNRPGEAFMFGGWRGNELGDTWKLVVGEKREDEEEVYGERIGETVWNERGRWSSGSSNLNCMGGSSSSSSSSSDGASRSGIAGFLHRFWG